MTKKLQIVTFHFKNRIDMISLNSHDGWEAVVISNPKLRGFGHDEESAINNLKAKILCEIGIINSNNYDNLSFKELSFDEIEIESIMDE